jgi:hypothetical protein
MPPQEPTLDDIPADSRASRTEPEHTSPQSLPTHQPANSFFSNHPSSAAPPMYAGLLSPLVLDFNFYSNLPPIFQLPLSLDSDGQLRNPELLEELLLKKIAELVDQVHPLQEYFHGAGFMTDIWKRMELMMSALWFLNEQSRRMYMKRQREESEAESKEENKKTEEESGEQTKEHKPYHKTPSTEKDYSHSDKDKDDKTEQEDKAVPEKTDEKKKPNTET